MRFPKYTFTLLVLFGVALIFFSCTGLEKENSFRFVFMTDIHVQPELDGDDGFKQAIAEVNTMQPKPDFVITKHLVGRLGGIKRLE